MDEKDCEELETLHKKEWKTEMEQTRYRELLRKFFDDTLYHGGDEE